jgi:hypothetical protein
MGLDQPQYAVLLSGKWGSGKTHFIEQFKSEHSSVRVVKISLFGLKSKEDIHKKIVLEQFNFLKPSGAIAKNVPYVLEKLTGLNLNLSLSDISVGMAIKQVWNKKTLFVFDDLERIEMSFPEAFGYINQLVEEFGQKVIFLADETRLKDPEEYQQFKEKIIGKTFEIQEHFEAAFEIFTDKLKNSKEILKSNQSAIKTVFEIAGYKNLRSLRQGILDFDRLMDSFEDKFKKHSTFMTEFIKVFFAFIFETKSGKYTIPPLEISLKDQVFREEDEQKPFIDHIVDEYYLDHPVLPDFLWRKFYWNQYLTAEEISESLSKSRFFKEQQEEWVTLGHYLYIEQSEFEKALQETLKKLEDNKYDDPIVLMHIVSTLLHLSRESLYDKSQQNIVIDMQEYISRNIAQWKNIDTLDHHKLEKYHSGLPPLYDTSPRYIEVQEYLLKKAEEVRLDGLIEKGALLIIYLKSNQINEFLDMLTVERNKGILYRLPVLNTINPQDFFDALIQVENKNMRDVFDVLKNRYRSVSAYEKESVLEELDFWKEVSIITNEYQMKVPYKIKDIWIKKHFCDMVEKEIIQKIEKEIKCQENTDQLEVTVNEQSNT